MCKSAGASAHCISGSGQYLPGSRPTTDTTFVSCPQTTSHDVTRYDRPMPVPITAILCVRNEEGYLRITLSHLVRNGVRLMIIDHSSSDGTRRILDEYGANIDRLDTLAWHGEFDLTAALQASARIAATVHHGWILHHDADEVMESDDPAESLADAFARIDATSATVINFDEFVFLPVGDGSFEGRDFHGLMRHYYFHAPKPLRLMRAWRADAGLAQTDGGHRLIGRNVTVHGRNLALRHYPFLSQAHARRKYRDRRFAARDLARGWHSNRIELLESDMDFPPVARLKFWTPGQALDTTEPWTSHYWTERRALRQ